MLTWIELLHFLHFHFQKLHYSLLPFPISLHSLALCVPSRSMARNKYGVMLLRVGLVVVALCILGTPLYWHFNESLAVVNQSSSTCAPGLCDWSSQPTLSIPQGLFLLIYLFNQFSPITHLKIYFKISIFS